MRILAWISGGSESRLDLDDEDGGGESGTKDTKGVDDMEEVGGAPKLKEDEGNRVMLGKEKDGDENIGGFTAGGGGTKEVFLVAPVEDGGPRLAADMKTEAPGAGGDMGDMRMLDRKLADEEVEDAAAAPPPMVKFVPLLNFLLGLAPSSSSLSSSSTLGRCSCSSSPLPCPVCCSS